MDYDQDLQLLKKSFRGGGEGAFYFLMLGRLAGRPHLDWLDIGIGRDGSALRPFVDFCRASGQSLAITGIDPDASPGRWSEAGVSWRLVRGNYQEWVLPASFDIINADQSLYYLPDLTFELRRALRALKPGGLLIATCWSHSCTLYRLRQRLFSDSCGTLVGEDLVRQLRSLPEAGPVTVAEFRTEVRLETWRSDPLLLEPAVRVLARSADCDDFRQQTPLLQSLLEEFPPVAERINLAVCTTTA